MSVPETRVEIGLTLVGGGVDPFKLDSATQGILGTNQIAGLEFYDVTDFVQHVSITRGRSQQLQYFQAGTATVVFKNQGREFDPLNTDSPYYPEIKPRRYIQITTDGTIIFYGLINDWDIEYDLAGNDSAIAYCSDYFSILANMKMSASTPSAQLSGARVNYVLDRSEVSFVGGRNIDAGSSTLGAFAIPADANVLNYLRQIERSEQGSFFVSSSGDVVFRDRNYLPNLIIEFSDAGDGLPYSSLTNEYGDELLYNRVVLQSPAGSAVTASDSESINDYQISELSWLDLLNSSTTEVSSLASYLVSKFSEPRVRFTGINLELSGQSSANIEALLQIELADYVNLKKSFDVGLPASVTQFSTVSGISHDIRPDSHRIGFNIEFVSDYVFLILGNETYGKLDESILSF